MSLIIDFMHLIKHFQKAKSSHEYYWSQCEKANRSLLNKKLRVLSDLTRQLNILILSKLPKSKETSQITCFSIFEMEKIYTNQAI